MKVIYDAHDTIKHFASRHSLKDTELVYNLSRIYNRAALAPALDKLLNKINKHPELLPTLRQKLLQIKETAKKSNQKGNDKIQSLEQLTNLKLEKKEGIYYKHFLKVPASDLGTKGIQAKNVSLFLQCLCCREYNNAHLKE